MLRAITRSPPMHSSDLARFLATLAASLLQDKHVKAGVVALVSEALDNALPYAIRKAAQPTHMTREQAAEYLGRSVRSVDGLRSSGKLAWSKRGGRVMIATADLDAYLDQGRVGAAKQRRAS